MDSKSFGELKFPIKYPHYFTRGGKEPLEAKLQPIYTHAKSPVLQITSSQGKLIITPKMAQTMIKKIPKMYPGIPSFHLSYTHFLEEAKKHPRQIVKTPTFMQRVKAKQKEFAFMKTMKRNKRSKRRI